MSKKTKKITLAIVGGTMLVAVVLLAVFLWKPWHSEDYSLKAIAIDKKHFPDAEFRQYVLDNFDKNGNGILDIPE